MRNFQSNRQSIQEQEQKLELDQIGLDADAEVQTQQQRERMLEQQLEQAQEIQQVQKVRGPQEIELPPARTRMSDYILQQLGGATFSALSSVLARTASRTGNSDLGGYSAAIGGIAGSAIYNSAMRLYPDLFNNIIADVGEYFGISPQDIIREARSTAPQGPQGPQRLVEDVKGEGKHNLGPEKAPILDSKSTPEQIDAFRASQGVPPANRGAMARLRGLGGAASAYFDDAMVRQYDRVKSELDPQQYDEKGMGTRYNIRGTPLRYDENGNRINPLIDPNEDVFYDRPDGKGLGGMEGLADARDYDGSRPSRIREGIERARTVADSVASRARRAIGTRLSDLNNIDNIERTPDEQRIIDDVRTRNRIVGGSAVLGAGLVGAGIVGGMNKQQPRIKENPLIFKHEQTTQGDGETNIERGAGKLKPKFIVPSANIFSKTEQEQYVDDMEFAMFDFVQDEGGNDPYGTNPILRDQHMTENLRYQRSGVNVYSLYGANLPDNPRNMPAKKMQEMFLGENRLPEMKFLFSNEFEAQEFNQSEFEVDEYDVNNERTAIEAFSPYANFTNNQLLDQFYDTSILYGVVP
jgi:hypothetical protein